MKANKLFALLLSVVMVISMTTVAFAADPRPESENPTVSVEIGTVTAAGKAAIDLYLDVDTTLRPYTAVEDEETLEMVYNGKGIRFIQIEYFLNEEYFDTSTTSIGTGYNNIAGKILSDGSIQWMKSATTSDTDWLTAESSFRMLRVTANVKDEATLAALGDGSTADLKAAAAEVLNSKTDLITYKIAIITISEYPEAGASTAGEAYWAYDTTYASDGNSDYLPILKTGADAPAEPDAPVVRDNPTIVDLAKTWTVDIDADYVAAGDTLTATLYDTTNETDTQEVTLSMGNNVVVGGAAWSFTLKATFENAAKMADIGLRVSK